MATCNKQMGMKTLESILDTTPIKDELIKENVILNMLNEVDVNNWNDKITIDYNERKKSLVIKGHCSIGKELPKEFFKLVNSLTLLDGGNIRANKITKRNFCDITYGGVLSIETSEIDGITITEKQSSNFSDLEIYPVLIKDPFTKLNCTFNVQNGIKLVSGEATDIDLSGVKGNISRLYIVTSLSKPGAFFEFINPCVTLPLNKTSVPRSGFSPKTNWGLSIFIPNIIITGHRDEDKLLFGDASSSNPKWYMIGSCRPYKVFVKR